MHRLRKVLREIHRRSVWQVLAVYLAGSCVVLEALALLTRLVGLPAWTSGFALVLLLIGLPIVTVTAIIQEGPPALTGEYRDEVDPNELVGRTPAEVHVDPAAHPLSGERLFTWRNATLGGVCAATLLVGSVTAYLAMWALGIGPVGSLIAQGVLERNDVVILADLTERVGDPQLAAALSEAFRVALAESSVMTPIDGRQVRDALRVMGFPLQRPLGPGAAREVAVREGVRAVVEADLSRVDAGGYAFVVRIVTAADGHAQAAFREHADDASDLLPAIDRVARRVREKVGESLREVRSGPSLEAVTTASLPALRLLAEADRADETGDPETAVGALREALSLDAGFAVAWGRLASLYDGQRGGGAAARDAATRAWEGAARLTKRDRQLAIATYHRLVTGDRAEEERAYRGLLEAHPGDPVAVDALAEALVEEDRWSDAAEILRLAVAGPAATSATFDLLVRSLYDGARKDEARRALERWRERYSPDYAWFSRYAEVLVGMGQPDSALAVVDEAVAALDEDLPGRVRLVEMGGRLAEARGRLDEAERRYTEGMALCDAQGLPRGWILFALDVSRVHGLRGGDPSRDLLAVDEGARRRLDDLRERDRPYQELGRAWAELGHDAARAGAWWNLMRATGDDPAFDEGALYRRHWTDRLAGRPEDALADLRELAARRPCAGCDLLETAAVFEELEEPDSAVAWLERWVAADVLQTLVEHELRLAPELARLAGLYEAVGRLDDARSAWLRFQARWAEADPVLQPRVSAARGRAVALAATTDTGDPLR